MDTSNTGESPSLEQEINKQNIITFMDSEFYKAAIGGRIDPFNSCVEPLNFLLTPAKNTILHVHISQPKKGAKVSISFMEQILAKCPSLLLQTNNKGETPLHLAARHGHDTIVQFHINWEKANHQDIETAAGVIDAKVMLRMENIAKETALHEAVRHNNLDVVRILTEEDPDFTYSGNQLGETPLYLAVEREYRDIVFRILDTCTLPAFDGPNGRTVLHEAVIRNNSELTEKILKAKKTLVKEVDQQGWTPLHHASHFGHLSIVKLLLECDKSSAYTGDKDGMTPLHLAAAQGDSHRKVVFWILEQCPDCQELVDHKGRNVLHFAVLSCSFFLSDHLLQGSNDTDYDLPCMTNLVNQKDVDGNTPLHLLASICLWNSNLISSPLVDKMAINNNNFTPLDVISKETDNYEDGTKGLTLRSMKNSGGYKQGLRGLIEVKDGSPKVIDTMSIESRKTSHMIVAALIVTVTFTAGFTLPGGYNGDDGSAIMSKSGAFATFIITDALAFALSTCALVIYYLIELGRLNNRRKQNFLAYSAFFILLSMLLMFVAFTAAVFAVLNQSTYLRVILCVITGFSIIICYFRFKNYVAEVLQN